MKILILIAALLFCSSCSAVGFLQQGIPPQLANTALANSTSSTAIPLAVSLPSCTDTSGNHLNYTNGTGFSCGTSGGGGSTAFAESTFYVYADSDSSKRIKFQADALATGRIFKFRDPGGDVYLVDESTSQTLSNKSLSTPTIDKMSFGTSVPTISSCGTSPSVDAHSSNMSGTVTVGSVSATSCTVTFMLAFSSFNHCRVTSQTLLTGFSYSYTLSAIIVSATGLTGDVIDYACDGV